MFPGYIFINTAMDNHSSVKYTKGIRNILNFDILCFFLNMKYNVQLLNGMYLNQNF